MTLFLTVVMLIQTNYVMTDSITDKKNRITRKNLILETSKREFKLYVKREHLLGDNIRFSVRVLLCGKKTHYMETPT